MRIAKYALNVLASATLAVPLSLAFATETAHATGIVDVTTSGSIKACANCVFSERVGDSILIVAFDKQGQPLKVVSADLPREAIQAPIQSNPQPIGRVSTHQASSTATPDTTTVTYNLANGGQVVIITTIYHNPDGSIANVTVQRIYISPQNIQK